MYEQEAAFNAIFVVNGQNHHFAKKSCLWLTDKSLIRRVLAQIIIRPWFDHFITICILINSIMLATRDYRGNYDPDFESEWNVKVEIVD